MDNNLVQEYFIGSSQATAVVPATKETTELTPFAQFNGATQPDGHPPPNDTVHSDDATGSSDVAQSNRSLRSNQPTQQSQVTAFQKMYKTVVYPAQWTLQVVRLLVAILLMQTTVFQFNISKLLQATQAALGTATARSANPSVIQEAEVRSAPMLKEHQDLVIKHMLRLNKIIYARDKRDIGRYTDRKTAIRQLARMTVVFRRYMHKHSQGDFKTDEGLNDLPESMVADIVDASFSVDKATREAGHAVIGAIHYDGDHEIDFGEEQECERLVQEMLANSTDQFLELYLVRTSSKSATILPQMRVDDDQTGWSIDFDYHYAANATDSDFDYRYILLPGYCADGMEDSDVDTGFGANVRERLLRSFFDEEEKVEKGKVEELPKESVTRKNRKMVDLRWPQIPKTDKPLLTVAAKRKLTSANSGYSNT